MMQRSHLPLLVTGASGHLGRLVLSELLNVYRIPPDQMIATTRNPSGLSELARRGVDVRYADFDQPDSLAAAFAGATRMLVISTTPEAPYVRGKRLRQQTAAIESGVRAGVEHIIYTSAPNPEPGTPCFWKEDHYLTEQALIASGVIWTILRNWEWPDWHLTEHWARALQAGELFTANGSGRVAHVTREDCARAAAGALMSEQAANRRFDITGPESLTADEIVALLCELSEKPIKVLHGTPEEFGERLTANGVSPHLVPVFVAYARGVRGGFFDGVSNHVELLSGTKPMRLRAFLAANLHRA